MDNLCFGIHQIQDFKSLTYSDQKLYQILIENKHGDVNIYLHASYNLWNTIEKNIGIKNIAKDRRNNKLNILQSLEKYKFKAEIVSIVMDILDLIAKREI